MIHKVIDSDKTLTLSGGWVRSTSIAL